MCVRRILDSNLYSLARSTVSGFSIHKAPQARLKIARHAAKQVPGTGQKRQVPLGTAEENALMSIVVFERTH